MDFLKKHKSNLCILHLRELLQPRQTQMTLEDFPAYSGGYPFSISGDIRSVPS